MTPLDNEQEIAATALAKAAARIAAQEAAALQAQSREALEEIADRAVRTAFRSFGLDPNSEDSVSDFRAAMADLRKWQKTRAEIYAGGIKALAGALALAAAVALLKAAVLFGVGR